MDAFLAAFLIPNLLINLISESMNQALVPTLIRVREREGPRAGAAASVEFMLWVCVLLTRRRLDGSGGAGLFPADRLALWGGEAGAFDPHFLCAAAGGADYRHRDELHGRAEYL